MPQYWRSEWKDIYRGDRKTDVYGNLGNITYEDTSTARRGRALTAETLDLAVGLDLVVLQDGHLDLLALVLDLLGSLELQER